MPNPVGVRAPGIDSSPRVQIGGTPNADLTKGVRLRARPTISGPRRLKVGSRTFGIPGEGVRVIRLRDRAEAVVFIVDRHGLIHALSERGEVDLPIAAEDALLKRFGSKVKDDDPIFFEGRAAFRSVVFI